MARKKVCANSFGRSVDSSDQAPYFFHQGTSCRAYDYLGVHKTKRGYVFRVWAPNADEVWICGDFDEWRGREYPMQRITERGVWEIEISSPVIREGSLYKYLLRNGEKEIYKADPYGVRMQMPPETASVIYDLDGYEWRDEGWMKYRAERFTRDMVASQPINIYELHFASWIKGEDRKSLSYADLARELASYVKQMGYTHVQLMSIAEHPCDGLWGYQVCGYFAPTSRFGSPKEFMQFVDVLHEAGIGVILDLALAHFPTDEHGLYEFDGQPLYGRADVTTWGTRAFDVGKNEVRSFLVSNAFYWAEKYHVDGLRADAVSSMLYLDFGKSAGEWTPNCYGDSRNLEAIEFFRHLNRSLAREHPDVMMIAEESTAFPNVTSFEGDGLGFTLKWNMGWTNDSLSYIEKDPLWRKYEHEKLTFALSYSFDERYVLPISHDEVTHGKRSLLGKMPGKYSDQFSGARAYLAYQMTHPGKKLTFMGCEIGQFCEWNANGVIEWFLTEFETHAQFQQYCADLNHLYLENPALWERDGDRDGFAWIDADNADHSIYSYRRMDAKGDELIILLNFTPVVRRDFLLGVPAEGVYEEIFNSDAPKYGGVGFVNMGELEALPAALDNSSHAINITVPPLSAVIFRRLK